MLLFENGCYFVYVLLFDLLHKLLDYCLNLGQERMDSTCGCGCMSLLQRERWCVCVCICVCEETTQKQLPICGILDVHVDTRESHSHSQYPLSSITVFWNYVPPSQVQCLWHDHLDRDCASRCAKHYCRAYTHQSPLLMYPLSI